MLFFHSLWYYSLNYELWGIYEVCEVHTLQHLHLHSSRWYAFEETVAKLVRKVPVQQRTLMSHVVAATHVDEQCGCSPHSLSLGHVGRSEVMHCIALQHLHLHSKVYLYFYEAVDVSIITSSKFDAKLNCDLNNLVEAVCLLRFSINLIRLFLPSQVLELWGCLLAGWK